MPENQIQVKLNPDVAPTGSDLAVVNAARRSFNQRSEWDYHTITHYEVGSGGPITEDKDYSKPTLKTKDKRLLEFLARGMTAGDFESFVDNGIAGCFTVDVEWSDEILYQEEELTKLLWEWRNTPAHDSPFNHCFISFEVKAPIFVARQLFKHEYLVTSEFSRRYKTDDVEFYTPDYWRKAAENKKQGSLEEPVLIDREYVWCDDNEPKHGWDDYTLEELLNEHEERGRLLFEKMVERKVAPEQARMMLPQATLTEWTWSGTLGAFAKMCQLRLHPEAQYEARLVAKQVYEYLKEYYPVSAKLLVEGTS